MSNVLLNERPRDISWFRLRDLILPCLLERVSLLFTLFRDEKPTRLFKQHTTKAINQ